MANQILQVIDANGAKQSMSVTQDPNGYLVGASAITDPSTGVKMTVGPQQNSDGQNLAAAEAALTSALELLFNGTSFDRRRGNVDQTALTLSGQGIGTITSPDQINYNHKGLQLGINIASLTGSPTIAVTIQGKDVASGLYYNILASTNIVATGFTLLTVYPGVTVAANAAVAQALPRTWRVSVLISGTGTVSGSFGASMIV